MLVKLFLFAAAALACSLPLASATGATVQLYSDSSCKTSIGEPLDIPLAFSPKCQSVASSPPVSMLFNCAADGSNTNFTLQLYNGTADCSGTLTVGIVSDDATGGCAKTTLTAEGQTQTAYSHIDCTASKNAKFGSSPVEQSQAQHSIEDIIDFVHDFQKGSEYKSVKYHDDGTYRHRSKFVKKLHH